MEITYITTKQDWEAAITQFPEANFLQSWQWGVFQEKLGKKVIRVQAVAAGETGLAELVIEKAKRGTYATVAGGPLMQWQNHSFVQQFFAELTRIAQSESCLFLRFRPQALETAVSTEVLAAIGARVAPMHVTADLTLQLDITQSDDALLAQMRKNTRYEIRKAEKVGITTTITTEPAEIEAFYQEQLAVAQRHNFVPFSRAFLYEQFVAFAADNQVALVHSWDNGQLLASAFIIFYNGEAVYHYGVSTAANAKLPGAYATQWRAIQEAQKRGCTRYNFWGIAPEGAINHRFAGVSLFKRGFGGTEVAYLPAHDIPLTWHYWLVWTFEQIRKKLRRL